MPTVLRIGPYRFHFFSDEGSEPAHIHVRFQAQDCKFWLEPVALANNRGVPVHRLNEIDRMIRENRDLLVRKYHEHQNRQC